MKSAALRASLDGMKQDATPPKVPEAMFTVALAFMRAKGFLDALKPVFGQCSVVRRDTGLYDVMLPGRIELAPSSQAPFTMWPLLTQDKDPAVGMARLFDMAVKAGSNSWIGDAVLYNGDGQRVWAEADGQKTALI